MRAVQVPVLGDASVLKVAELDDPIPGTDEVLIDVAFAGVNFIDTYQRGGLYPCLLYTSPSPRDATLSRMPSSA